MKNFYKKDSVKTLLLNDPYLLPYKNTIKKRLKKIVKTATTITRNNKNLADFASGYKYFGLFLKKDHWVFREWAPNAQEIYLTGNMTDWKPEKKFQLKKINKNGVWEIHIDKKELNHKDLYKLYIKWRGGEGERIPSYADYVHQDPNTHIFSAQVWVPAAPFNWKNQKPKINKNELFIYETHIGMAQKEERVGTYKEFTKNILPKIASSGYNAIELMAIQEHPYYGSFGYQVSSFFAPSSRFGTPEDLKILIDTAHGLGLTVLMDIIHSHAVSNANEGLALFDGTAFQYFHEGTRGDHPAWGSKCFDYKKPQILHFLLSNLKYWLDEFHVDGFRFDGVTSMLYHNRGLGKAFTSYNDYFNESVDEDALVYLSLANQLIHSINPDNITIAEDISGMPGLALSSEDGGTGFDYRFAMGIPDFWIKLTKDIKDEDWPVSELWYELTNRRFDEKTISYAECHDQALVGDQTLIFRLIGADMYTHMKIIDNNIKTDRGIALHKMIRLITMSTAGSGYLNFMGNEFGHPEWIDFPREGNNWSYKYTKRQWHLSTDPALKYKFLKKFDEKMIETAKKYSLFSQKIPELLYEHNDDKIIIFMRANLLFVFNFHWDNSYTDYMFKTPPGKYTMTINSDEEQFGGFNRLNINQAHFSFTNKTSKKNSSHYLSLYIPCRCAIILRKEI